jgi:hypothetical protein
MQAWHAKKPFQAKVWMDIVRPWFTLLMNIDNKNNPLKQGGLFYLCYALV